MQCIYSVIADSVIEIGDVEYSYSTLFQQNFILCLQKLIRGLRNLE